MRQFSIRKLASVFFFILAVSSLAKSQSNPGKIVFYQPSVFRLLAINGDGTGQTALTEGGSPRDSDPVFSPDGTKIAFNRDINNVPNIFVMNSDGTNPALIIPAGPFSSSAFSSHPTWSPDGSKFAFVSNRNGDRRKEIFVVNIDGTGLVQLTTNVQLGSDSSGPDFSWDLDPTWSPDGSRIAFASNRNGSDFELYVMNADGSNQTRLTNNTAIADRTPTWSPDSQRIAFFRSGSDGGIFTMNRDGTNVIRITNDGFAPSWSPDGSRLAFSRFVGSFPSLAAIFVMNADGTGATRITNNNFDCLAPTWAPTSSTPIPTSSISGHVLDGSNMPVSGATLSLSGTLTKTTQSDPSGAYSFTGLPAGNYTISISKPGLGFTPATVSFNNLTSNQIADFTAFAVFSVSGQVTGLDSLMIPISLTGSQTRSVQIDSHGNYVFDSVPAGGNYTVAINSKIWNATPSSGFSFNNLSTNQTANFSVVRARYTISGRLTRLGNPMQGVTVTLDSGSGSPPTTTTDANGKYFFADVVAGFTYSVRATAPNIVFSPQDAGFNQLDGDKTADFIGLSANHLLFNTRYVFGGASNNCIVELTVNRGGNAQGVGPITVRYATTDGSARAGTDYVATSGTLNFPEGTFSQTVDIPLLAAANTGLPRTFLVTLSDPTGQVDLAQPSSVTVVLTDPASPSSLVLATQPNSNQAVALNVSNQLAEPFTPSTAINFGQDTQTRVSFFVSGVQFNACQGTNAVFFSGTDSQQHSFSGTVEQVVKLPGNNPYLQLIIQLPQGFVTGDWTIRFGIGGLTTNTAHLLTRP